MLYSRPHIEQKTKTKRISMAFPKKTNMKHVQFQDNFGLRLWFLSAAKISSLKLFYNNGLLQTRNMCIA